jgi:membrane dipeptidase
MPDVRPAPPVPPRGFPAWVDGHLDLGYLAVAGRNFTAAVAEPTAGCVSYPDLAEAPVGLALATIFTEARAAGQPAGYRDSEDVEGAHRVGVEQLEWYLAEEAAGRMRIVRTATDLERTKATLDDPRPTGVPLSVVLLMEGADPIRTPNEAAWWFAQGVRMVGLSWAYGSRYSGGNSTGGAITAAGRDLVAALDELGILHDASHLSDRSFDDLLTLTSRRVVATHSNCRALLEPKERHLRDDQARSIALRDGIIGLNLFAAFLAVDRPATVDDALDHVERMAGLAGRDRCGLGSDLDGGFPPSRLPAGLRHPRSYARLAAGLAARGWSESEIDGFRSRNWLRVLLRALPRDLPRVGADSPHRPVVTRDRSGD